MFDILIFHSDWTGAIVPVKQRTFNTLSAALAFADAYEAEEYEGEDLVGSNWVNLYYVIR